MSQLKPSMYLNVDTASIHPSVEGQTFNELFGQLRSTLNDAVRKMGTSYGVYGFLSNEEDFIYTCSAMAAQNPDRYVNEVRPYVDGMIDKLGFMLSLHLKKSSWTNQGSDIDSYLEDSLLHIYEGSILLDRHLFTAPVYLRVHGHDVIGSMREMQLGTHERSYFEVGNQLVDHFDLAFNSVQRLKFVEIEDQGQSSLIHQDLMLVFPNLKELDAPDFYLLSIAGDAPAADVDLISDIDHLEVVMETETRSWSRCYWNLNFNTLKTLVCHKFSSSSRVVSCKNVDCLILNVTYSGNDFNSLDLEEAIKTSGAKTTLVNFLTMYRKHLRGNRGPAYAIPSFSDDYYLSRNSWSEDFSKSIIRLIERFSDGGNVMFLVPDFMYFHMVQKHKNRHNIVCDSLGLPEFTFHKLFPNFIVDQLHGNAVQAATIQRIGSTIGRIANEGSIDLTSWDFGRDTLSIFTKSGWLKLTDDGLIEVGAHHPFSTHKSNLDRLNKDFLNATAKSLQFRGILG